MAKVSLNVQGGRLYLMSRFPRRDGEQGTKQARIALGLDDTPGNRKLAEKKCAACQKTIDKGTFDWADWVAPAKAATWRKGIDALHHKRCVLGRCGPTTWDINYMGRLKQLDPRQTITKESVRKALSKYGRHQCSYKELYYLLKEMCALVKIEFPDMPVPLYDPQMVEVPTDEEIVDWVTRAKPEESWAFGMMAAYGLRPHELAECKFIDKDHNLQVQDKTKTGFRTVATPRPDWVALFDLRNERRFVSHADRPDAIAAWLFGAKKRLGITYKPYALRHAYAAQLWKVGGSQMDIYTAARLMGHSVKEHERTYRAHIHPHTIAQAARSAFARNADMQRQQLDAALGSDCVDVDA